MKWFIRIVSTNNLEVHARNFYDMHTDINERFVLCGPGVIANLIGDTDIHHILATADVIRKTTVNVAFTAPAIRVDSVGFIWIIVP